MTAGITWAIITIIQADMETNMTKSREEDFIAKLKFLQCSLDTEKAHIEADAILCEFLNELGYQNLVNEYNEIDKWFA